MNRALSGEDGGWVRVVEDDVIVRCLVRGNVASLDPQDGSRVRLVEFHKEIEGDEMDVS